MIPDPDPELLEELADQPTGMQDTQLRSMKDQLLIETSEMLGVGSSVCACVHIVYNVGSVVLYTDTNELMLRSCPYLGYVTEMSSMCR